MTDFNRIWQYNFPTIIRFGAGAGKELADHRGAQGFHRPLLVTDPMVAQLEFFHQIKESLTSRNFSVEVFSDIHKNPVKSDVEKGGAAFSSSGRDCIIGIGGGGGGGVAGGIFLSVPPHKGLFSYYDLLCGG